MTTEAGRVSPADAQRVMSPRLVRAALAVLMVLHTLLLGWQGYRDSATWDEVGHFAAGLNHHWEGKFDLYRVNPPLVRLVATAPVVWLMHPQGREIVPPAETGPNLNAYGLEYNRPEFEYGRQIAAANGERYFWLLTVARWACIPFSLLALTVCFLWGRDLFGAEAGLLAAALWAFSPSTLAYGHLITPDTGAAALGLAAVYVFWKWLQTPTVWRGAGAAMLLGLAELTKSTWLVLFPLLPMLWAGYRFLQRPRLKVGEWGRQGAGLAVMLAGAMVILNAGYMFRGTFAPVRSYAFASQALGGTHAGHPATATAPSAKAANRFAGSWLGGMPLPLPADYILGIDYIKTEYEHKYWSYLNGQWRLGGWWYYYLYAMAVKEPLGTWALAALAAVLCAAAGRRYRATWGDELVLLAPAAVVLVLVSSQTGFNHHLRYVLPAFPFLFVWIARAGRTMTLRQRPLVGLAGGALAWSIASSLMVFPHSMSYFNELAGGPMNGHWHLGNSNTDWGQDLLYLKAWYERHPQARPLHVAYGLPLIDPKMAGIDARPVPQDPAAPRPAGLRLERIGPRPGWFAVSVNELHTGSQRKYEYFLRLKPAAWAGYSLPIYHLTLEEANALRREYGLPELWGME